MYTLDDEIDAWEQERGREQQVFEEERAQDCERAHNQQKEDAILQRLLGTPGAGDERPPTRWSKPASHLQFFAESEFLSRPQRLMQTVFSPDRTPSSTGVSPDRNASSTSPSHRQYTGKHATSSVHGRSPAASSLELRGRDALSSETNKPRSRSSFRRSKISLQVIEEGETQEKENPQLPGGRWGSRGTARSVSREVPCTSPRGQVQATSHGESRPTSTGDTGAARILFSAMKGSPWSRSATPQVLCTCFTIFKCLSTSLVTNLCSEHH